MSISWKDLLKHLVGLFMKIGVSCRQVPRRSKDVVDVGGPGPAHLPGLGLGDFIGFDKGPHDCIPLGWNS